MRFDSFTDKEIAVLQIATHNLATDAERVKIEDTTAHTLCLEIEEASLERMPLKAELAVLNVQVVSMARKSVDLANTNLTQEYDKYWQLPVWKQNQCDDLRLAMQKLGEAVKLLVNVELREQIARKES